MKTKTKVILDEWIAKGSVMFLNIMARILGKVMHIDHTFPKNPKRIVVCKFLGMGSIIQATPLLQTLRKNYPSTEIVFLTSIGNRVLLEGIPDVNTILTIDDKKLPNTILSTFKVLRNLWKKKAEIYIDLETYSYFSTALATVSCATNRIGFYRLERNIRMGVHTHMMFFNPRASIAQSYLQMARLIGCKDIVKELFKFQIREVDVRSKTEKLEALNPGSVRKKYIIINPNASDLRLERRWPAAEFITVIEKLNALFPEYNLILVGAKNERQYVDVLYSGLKPEIAKCVLNTAGKFTLYELFALINDCSLIITNDTGPMHISFSLEKPTVALFGPASPSQYGQNKNVFGIYRNLYCSPCVHDFLTPPCYGDNQCMKQITVADVVSLASKILSGNLTNGISEEVKMSYTKNDAAVALGNIVR